MKRTHPVTDMVGGLQRVLVQTEVTPSPMAINGHPVVHRYWRYLDGFERCDQEAGPRPVQRFFDHGQGVPTMTARQQAMAAQVLLSQMTGAHDPSPEQTFVWKCGLEELWLQEADGALLEPIRAALARF